MRFHEKRFAEEYHKRLVREGYPGALLPPVLEAVKDTASLIDAGGGSGFFAVPIAEKNIPVTLVEPSAAMIQILRLNIKPGVSSLITPVNQTWEEWNGERHETLLCAHSLYPMSDPEKALKKMVLYAEKRIIIVRDDQNQHTLGDAVRARFASPRKSIDFTLIIESTMNELKVPFIKQKIEQDTPVNFNDIKSEASHYAYTLKADNRTEAEIAAYLEEICEQKNDGTWFYNSFHSDFIYFF